MRSEVLLVVMFCSCGHELDSKASDLAAARVAIGHLGSAIVGTDPAALYELLTPDLRNRYTVGSAERERALSVDIEHQRSGWMRTLGEDAQNPRIHSVTQGYADELEVTLEIDGQPSEKKLYFRWIDGELKFSGVVPNQGPAVSVTALMVNRKFAIENFLAAERKYAWGGDYQYGSGGCGGYATTPVAGYHVNFTYYNCTEAGLGSCHFQANSDKYYTGENWCAGKHDHGTNGGCWWQWIGDDLWYTSDAWHGASYDFLCNP